MSTSTYSFSDILFVISNPAVGAYTLNGQGIGEVAISYAQDNTVANLASDASIMFSKVKADNGSFTISMQQTSQLHAWLKSVFNVLYALPASNWAAGQITISSAAGLFDNIILTGVAITKRSDQPYQQQGQMVTWHFMYSNGNTIGSLIAAIANNI